MKSNLLFFFEQSPSLVSALARKRLEIHVRALARHAAREWRAMRAVCGRKVLSTGSCSLFAVAAVVVLAGYLAIGFAPSAQALPSFARQTGQPCGTCHTSFPGLTPFGRRFKLLGYTTGGGQFRTTPFSSNDARNVQAEYNKLLGYAETVKVPP